MLFYLVNNLAMLATQCNIKDVLKKSLNESLIVSNKSKEALYLKHDDMTKLSFTNETLLGSRDTPSIVTIFPGKLILDNQNSPFRTLHKTDDPLEFKAQCINVSHAQLCSLNKLVLSCPQIQIMVTRFNLGKFKHKLNRDHKQGNVRMAQPYLRQEMCVCV